MLIQPGSKWITPCAGSSYYYNGVPGDPAEHPYCFTMSATQFQSMLVSMNSYYKLNLSTNPNDYELINSLLDVEDWTAWADADPRQALAVRDMSLQVVRAP